MPASLDNMSCDEQPFPESSLLSTLSRVPQLLIECSRQMVLKELRSVCRQAYAAATPEISRMTISFEHPSLSMDLPGLHRVIQCCSIRSLKVVVHAACFDRLEADLSELVSMLGPHLNHVGCVELSLILAGNVSERVERRGLFWNEPDPLSAEVMSASVIKILSPACGPLTSLTVNFTLAANNGHCSTGAFGHQLLMQALHDVSATTSLKDLAINITGNDRRPIHCNWITRLGDGYTPSEQNTDATSLALLSRFQCLTSLKLSCGTLMDEEAWRALPRTLESLELHAILEEPPADIDTLPYLHMLTLHVCDPYVLARLLTRLQALRTLSLSSLEIFGQNRQKVAHMVSIFEHPLLSDSPYLHTADPVSLQQQQQQNLDGSGAGAIPGCKISKVHLDTCLYGGPCELAMWECLAMLPVMAGVFNCEIEFDDRFAEHHPCEDRGLEVLKCLPRVFPNLEKLVTYDLDPSDEAIAALASCASLRSLSVYCDDVWQAPHPAWKSMLPGVVEWGQEMDKMKIHRAYTQSELLCRCI